MFFHLFNIGYKTCFNVFFLNSYIDVFTAMFWLTFKLISGTVNGFVVCISKIQYVCTK